MAARRLPISIHPLFWLFAALLGWIYSGSLLGTAVWVVVILVSVLWHELGHALTGLAFGQEVRIQLVMFGGLTYRHGPKISLFKEFILTLNGPVAGFLLAAITFALWHFFPGIPPLLHATLNLFWRVNIFWSVINLLPVLPLDGGHLLRIVLEAIFGAKGASYALFVGVVLGAGLGVFCLVYRFFIGAVIFFLLAFDSFRAWTSYRHITEADKDEDLQTLFRETKELSSRGLDQDALIGFEEIRKRTQKGILFDAATEEMARINAEAGHDQEAFDLLQGLGKRLSPENLPLYHRLAYRTAHFDTAIQIGRDCYQVSPTSDVATINALASAALHDSKAAIGWLQTALREGLPDVAKVIQDPAFDSIRSEATFQQFVASMGKK